MLFRSPRRRLRGAGIKFASGQGDLRRPTNCPVAEALDSSRRAEPAGHFYGKAVTTTTTALSWNQLRRMVQHRISLSIGTAHRMLGSDMRCSCRQCRSEIFRPLRANENKGAVVKHELQTPTAFHHRIHNAISPETSPPSNELLEDGDRVITNLPTQNPGKGERFISNWEQPDAESVSIESRIKIQPGKRQRDKNDEWDKDSHHRV